MKKTCAIALSGCLMLLPLIGNAQGHLSVADVNANPPARWTQTYETKWRTVEIDVQPAVPEVDKMPMLKIAPEYWQPDASLLDGDYESTLYEFGSFGVNVSNAQEISDERRRIGTTTGVEKTENFYPPFDFNATYSRHSDFTLGEAVNELQSTLEIFGQEDAWAYNTPYHVQIYSLETKDGKTTFMPDSYGMHVSQKLHDIPLLCHVLEGIDDEKAGEVWFLPDLSFSVDTEGSMSFSGGMVRIIDILAEDVPLCDFSVVKANIEQEIEAGHIRRIFDVDLGYAIYNEPGSSAGKGEDWFRSHVAYAVPVWRINCYYIDSAKKEMRDYTSVGVSSRGEIEYKMLIVNAQTGEVVDMHDNHRGCADYQGFISWEDVGGKP